MLTPHLIPLLCCLFLSVIVARFFEPQLKFVWYCFIRPLGPVDQKARLDKVSPFTSFTYSATYRRDLSFTKARQISTTRRVVLSSEGAIQC